LKRIIFFHQGRLSNVNGSIYRGLCARFPEAEVHLADINKMLKARPWIIAINLVVAFWVYGWDMVRRKRDLDESFFGTAYIFGKIKKLAHKVHKQWPADFSFQSWSMFDCSVPDTPHFVYTDHTYLSCRDYPDYGKQIWAPVRRPWAIELEKSIYANAACIFTQSQNVTKTLTDVYRISSKKVLCVGVGTNVSLEKLCKIPTVIDRYKNKTIVFVSRSVGRRWILKGGPELLEAFRQVVKKHKNAKLIIVGCNPPIEETYMEVVGSVKLEQVIDYLAKAAIYCMPTKMEPFGIAFLEAMAAGLPVVALRLGAAPDFIIPGKTGELVEHGDIEGLAGALTSLLDNPEKCRRYGENGRALVQEKYNWDKVFKKMGSKILELARPESE
jgi:glycosyltransferase involved in cell wall biosynthesis